MQMARWEETGNIAHEKGRPGQRRPTVDWQNPNKTRRVFGRITFLWVLFGFAIGGLLAVSDRDGPFRVQCFQFLSSAPFAYWVTYV